MTDPWGTPEITGAGDDFTPFTMTACCLFVRNDWSHLPILPLMPKDFNLDRVTLKSSLSKALAKSR